MIDLGMYDPSRVRKMFEEKEDEIAQLKAHVVKMREALGEALGHDCDMARCHGHMEDYVKPRIRRALAAKEKP